MKAVTITAFFVASVLLIGVGTTSPVYAYGTSPEIVGSGPMTFLEMFLGVIQGSGWGWL